MKENKSTKNGTIGLILGGISFLPVWMAIVYICNLHIIFGLILAIITQSLWLWSIHLCTSDLEIRNRKLVNRIKELEELNKNVL